MKFVYTADWHLSGYGNDKVDPGTHLTERLLNLKNALYNMVEYCEKNEIKNIKVGGDILHNKSIIHTKAQAILLQLMRDNRGIIWDVIDGNHDLEGKGQNVTSALLPLDSEPNVNRIGTEKGYIKDEVNDILYVPYSTRMIDNIKNNSATILIAHLGLNEGVLNAGQSIVSDLGIKSLRGKYKICLFGHYHTPQEIIEEDLIIYYPGSLIQLDWRDKNEEKRFLSIDTNKGIVESIPTTGYTKYIEFIITDENKKEVIKQAREFKEQGHNVKIRKNEKINTSEISEEFMIVDRTEQDITNRGIDKTMSNIDIMKKYMEIKDVSSSKRKRYEEIGLDCISSVEEK